MHVRLLGTAAGGGFPQWNCACLNCRTARSHPDRAVARLQTCVALSADEQQWFLVGASPDVRSQIESYPLLRGSGSVRGSAVEGILLASADLDHVLGLFVLREASRLCVHATPAVRRSVCEGLRLDNVLARYCCLEWREPPDRLSPLRLAGGSPSGLLLEAFPAPVSHRGIGRVRPIRILAIASATSSKMSRREAVWSSFPGLRKSTRRSCGGCTIAMRC